MGNLLKILGNNCLDHSNGLSGVGFLLAKVFFWKSITFIIMTVLTVFGMKNTFSFLTSKTPPKTKYFSILTMSIRKRKSELFTIRFHLSLPKVKPF